MNRIFMAVFGLLFFICSTCSAYAPDGKLFVTMLDVGQGDAFLIETPTQNILLDTGDVGTREQLVNQLHAAGIARIERIILTHPHADHIGGVKAVLKNFTVDEIIDNGYPSTSPLYKKYRQADVIFSTLMAGDILNCGGGIYFEVLSPDPNTYFSNINNQSIVGKLVFGDFSIMFTGDAEKPVEKDLLERYTGLKATILKAGHHGSKTSSSAKFVTAVNPEFVLISCGLDNGYDHPHKRPLEIYLERGIPSENIFCTAFNGSVRIEVDYFGFTITPERYVDWVDGYKI